MENQPPATGPNSSTSQDSAARPAAPLPRLRRADRSRTADDIALDLLLPDDDVARLVWPLVENLDFTPWVDDIKARDGRPGRDATDPSIFFALWLYATLDGVSSAREVERLCYRHIGYAWLRGGVSINYHSLADFRVRHPDRLQQLLADCVSAMLAEDLISLDQTAQDGLRCRASAGSSSFRRRASVEEARQQAKNYLEQLSQTEQAQATPREQAARQRSAEERLERLDEALAQLGQLEKQRAEGIRPDQQSSRGAREPRVSTTDPECRKMKMPDGGYRPAYNVQLNTTVEGGVIVSMEVVAQGNDYGQVEPMLQQSKEDYGQAPAEHLVDGGFASLDEIQTVSEKYPETKLYAPVKDAAKQEAEGKKPYEPKTKDKPGVAAWRVRMGTEQGKEKYKLRAQTAECANAQLRNRGLYQVNVRGLAKVKAAVLWYVLAYNLMRWVALRALAAA